MRITHSALLVGAVALLGLGLFAGSVAGDDGGIDVADRLGGGFGDPIEQVATLDGPARAETAAKRKKPKVLHGRGQAIELAGGANSLISLQCPKKYPVPVSAGLDTSIAGIFPGIITRDDRPRAMLVAAVNATDRAGRWTATMACMKGVKEA
jgi:hypothetical protein